MRETSTVATSRHWPAARLLMGLATAGLLAACAQAGQAAADAPAGEAALLARIEAEVGEARCTVDADCRTLPIGARACGGPERWLAWSQAPGRDLRLKAWADELASRARARQAKAGMMSTCQVATDPGARCVASRCTLGSAAQGAR